nr:vitellogenin-like isoform X1 [Procambarus clarkii]
MTAWAALLVFTILVVVVGARAGDAAICSRECPIAGAPKLFYQEGKTYTYGYSGESKVQLKGVEGGHTERDWSAQVELSWITPCDMVISLKLSKTDGVIGPNLGNALERYPLVVAVADGRVQQVCTFPDDDAWSINIKKGIASAFQNSLPSNSTTNSGLSITETDVVGTCPTRYEVQNHGDRVIVKKEKNHRLCKQRYPTPAETQVPWLKGPLPLEESRSVCKQEIRNGIYSSITCEDKNVVRPSYGAYKYIEARQESTLRYISESNDQSGAASAIPQANMERKSLRYDHDTLKKDPSMVAQLDQTMSQICEKTKDAVERDVAALVALALHLLRRVPEDAVEQTLVKIRNGSYCEDWRKLENLFLDVVSFVHEVGAVKVMVSQLVSGQATGGRAALYTAGLYLHTRPTSSDIEALVPVFESRLSLPFVTLAAASMVKAYCHDSSLCDNVTSVRTIVQALNNKIQSQCSPLSDEDTQNEALASLKVLGNMGLMTPEEATSVIRCMKTEGVLTSVRVAAAQAFRQSQCAPSTTEQLIKIAIDSTSNTEVRIAAYLAAIRCVQEGDLETILASLAGSEDTQVRGFILSHLVNLQETNSPHKGHLRYLLTNILLPRDFETDVRKYSRNIDVSYFSSSLGAGAGVESNIIYSPGSFVPRSVDFNLTAASGEALMDIGEVGVRLEGLDPMLEKAFGPRGYLRRTSPAKMFNYILNFLEKEGKEIIDNIRRMLREDEQIDMASLTDFWDEIYCCGGPDVVRADIFARFMGQEIYFSSLSGNLDDIAASGIGRTIGSYITQILHQIKNVHVTSTRTAQLYLDYSFPTIQGTPFKFKLEGTAVTGLQLEGSLNILDLFFNFRNGQNVLKILPSLSVQIDNFIGFDDYLSQTGIKTNSTISTSNGFSLSVKAKNKYELVIQWDLPEKMEVINVKSETYLMMSERGRPETKVIPQSMKDTRIRTHSCINSLEPALGLKFCYELDTPDVFRSNSLPLGAPAIAKLYVEKEEPSIIGYNITYLNKRKETSQYILLKIDTLGSSKPREAELLISFSKQGYSVSISASFDSLTFSSGVWITIINSEDYKAILVYTKFRNAQTELTRGLKVDFRTKSSLSDKEYELNVFSSPLKNFPLASKVVEMKLAKTINRPEVSMDFLCGTRNYLRNYFDLNFEVVVDVKDAQYLNVSLPTRLRKLEFHSGLRDWQVNAFILQTRESGENTQHSSAFRITRRRKEVIAVEATHTTQGNLYDNFIIRTTALVKVSHTQYKAATTVQNGGDTTGVSVHLTRAGDKAKLATLEALHTYSGKPYGIILLVDIPRYMEPIEFEFTTAITEENILQLKFGLTYGNQVILRVFGPVTFETSSAFFKFKAAITVITAVSGRHFVSAVVNIANNTQGLSFTCKRHRRVIVSVDCSAVTVTRQETVTAARVMLPGFVDFTTDIITNDRFVYITLNGQLSLANSYPHRLRGYTNVDLENMNAKVDISWDADHEPDKKINVDVMVVIAAGRPSRLYLQGDVEYQSITYPVVLEASVANLLRQRYEDCTLTLVIRAPENKNLSLEITNAFQHHASSASIDTGLHYKSMQDKEYAFASHTYLERFKAPFSFMYTFHAGFTSPRGQTASVRLEAKHRYTPAERVAYIQGSVSFPAMKEPLKLEFKSNQTENLYSLGWIAEANFPATMYNIELLLGPGGSIRSFNSFLNVTAIKDFTDAVVKLLEVEMWCFGKFCDIDSNAIYIYHYRFHKPTPITYSMIFKSPSRTMEGEAEYSPSQSSLKFYPNRDHSEDKYQIATTSSHSNWDQESKYEGRISHPVLTKDMLVEVQFSSGGGNLTGSIELDIFPDTADKITGTLQSSMIANNTVLIEALFTSRIFKNGSKLIVKIGSTPHTTGFDVMLQRNATSEVSLQVSAKYDTIPGGEATVAFQVINDEGAVVDVAGVMEREEVPECKGHKVKAAVITSFLGSYDMYLKVGRPFYFEMTTDGHGSLKSYTIKLEFQTLKNFEATLSVHRKLLHETHPVVMARIKPLSFNLIDVELAYKRDEYKMIQDTVLEECVYVVKTWLEWSNMEYQRLVHEARAQNITFPPAELSTLMGKILLDMSEIYQNLREDELTPAYEFFSRIVAHPGVTYAREVAYRTGVVLRWALNHLPRHNLQPYREHINWRKETKGFNFVVKEAAVRVIRAILLVDGGAWVRHHLFLLRHSSIYAALKKEVDAMMRHHPQEYEAIQQVVAQVEDVLEADLDDIQKHPLALGVAVLFFRKIDEVIQKVRVNEMTLVYNVLWAYDSYTINPLNNILWLYYLLQSRSPLQLLPPYDRTAMVIGDTEILTFDGAKLRVPVSPCEVILVSYSSSKLTMAHPDASAPPQITFVVASTTAIIKSNYNIEVNGKRVRDFEVTYGDVTIHQTHLQIKLISPFMTVRVAKRQRIVSLETSGWTFAHLDGLMGTYDGEAGNDWFTSTGTRASSLQELVTSWQEDQQCPTPAVPPVSPAQVSVERVLHCYPLLGMWSRCNSLVRPEPFIHFCYVTSNPCDAAQAYRTVCSIEGISPLVPRGC